MQAVDGKQENYFEWPRLSKNQERLQNYVLQKFGATQLAD